MLMDVILNVVACSLVVYQQYLKFNMSRMNASSFLHKHIHVSLLPILVKKKSILMQSFHYFQILSTTKFYRSVLPLNVTRHKLFCISLPLFRLACWAPFPKSYNPSVSNYPQCTVYPDTEMVIPKQTFVILLLWASSLLAHHCVL